MANTTIGDVAAKAGVSKSTVSHVLNATRFVEPETEARVRQAMQALNYRPNLLARSLRRQETRTIALLTPDNTNAHWAALARVIEQAGFAAGYTVLLCNSEWSVEREKKYLETLLARQIDGLIMAATLPHVEVLESIAAAKLPVVMINAIQADQTINVVKVDGFRGGYLAGEYLVRLGHRRMGCIRSRRELGISTRVEGFNQALRDAGIDLASIALAEGDFSFASGEAGVQDLLTQQPNLTAVFAVNDNMALGALRGLRRMNRRVPDDISLIGFDDIIYATVMTPELTTIAQPVQQMGEAMVSLLLKQIDEPKSAPQHIMLEPTLIERESCRAIG